MTSKLIQSLINASLVILEHLLLMIREHQLQVLSQLHYLLSLVSEHSPLKLPVLPYQSLHLLLIEFLLLYLLLFNILISTELPKQLPNNRLC